MPNAPDIPYISPDNLLDYHLGLKLLFALKTDLNDKADKSTTYTKQQVDDAITTAIAGVTQIQFSVVQALPATGEAGVIYLIANGNVYDEYIYVNNAFEKLGSTDADLSGYVQTSQLREATDAEIETILAS